MDPNHKDPNQKPTDQVPYYLAELILAEAVFWYTKYMDVQTIQPQTTEQAIDHVCYRLGLDRKTIQTAHLIELIKLRGARKP